MNVLYLCSYGQSCQAENGQIRHCCFLQVASGCTVMAKQCECHVISFPATVDQCCWIAVAGSNSIVRYGLGSWGKYEGLLLALILLAECGCACALYDDLFSNTR